ncbi:MAG: twin-arginine translocase TatA/TatE family subunit [Acidobacteriota bacterium]|jgi:sec-independent protein translocase protein TatA|nr:twin-arginine translocase TatA/TatE family subunit [Acidobacteriota bacterium]
MGSLGMQEIVIIFIIALIVFGPRKLPEIGKTIGKGLAEFKKASNELKQTWEDEVNLDKEKAALKNLVTENTINPSEIVEDIANSISSDSASSGTAADAPAATDATGS